MAYNSSYETLYGFDALDTFHNFFPEIMYDDTMFDNEILHWMRYRMNSLFPTVYPRQQNMYRIYSSQARRALFQTFQNTRNTNTIRNVRPATVEIVGTVGAVGTVPVPVTVSTQRVAPLVTTAVVAPTRTTFSVSPISTDESPAQAQAQTQAQTQAPASQAQVRSSVLLPASGGGLASLNVHDPLEDLLTALLSTTPQPRQSDAALLTSMFGGIGSLGTWTTARNELFTDVVVIPTHAQVEEGSEIVHLEDVPEEASCAVCQERGTDDTWRHLYCEHYFHRDCIDRWFSRNVHCPVCRADIRTPHSE